MSLMDDMYRNKITECIRTIYAAKYVREDNIPCKIEEVLGKVALYVGLFLPKGLFLGSVGVSYNKEALRACNVTHVLIVAKSLDPAYPTDFIYKKVGVLDVPEEKLENYFDECFEFIEQAKRDGSGVLVHCFAGRSRSVTIIVSYLMKKHHMSMSEAMSLVKSKRPQIAPNLGFVAQLMKFEKTLHGVETAAQ